MHGGKLATPSGGCILNVNSYSLFCFFLNVCIFFFRDAGVIAIGHFVWAILSVLFVFSMIGVAHKKQSLNIENIKNSDMATSITGKGFWLIGITLAESALASMDYNWLWYVFITQYKIDIVWFVTPCKTKYLKMNTA